MTEKPAIICVAITGSLPTKADNSVVPIDVPERIESTQAAFEAGAIQRAKNAKARCRIQY